MVAAHILASHPPRANIFSPANTFFRACCDPHPLEISNPAHRFALSRFRTSCHDLRIERERYLPRPAQFPRHERTCLQCASPAIEDETHMVFHCPTYDHLRFEYADLLPPDLPHPSLAFCRKIRLELLHSSTIALFTAAEIRV